MTTSPIISADVLTEIKNPGSVLFSDNGTGRRLGLSAQGKETLAALKDAFSDREQMAFHVVLSPNILEAAYDIVGLQASRFAQKPDLRALDMVLENTGLPRITEAAPVSSIIAVAEKPAVYDAAQITAILKDAAARKR